MDRAYLHRACMATGASCRNCRFQVRNTACFSSLPDSLTLEIFRRSASQIIRIPRQQRVLSFNEDAAVLSSAGAFIQT
jgi:hypothetical protein